jgi:amidase
MSPDEYVRHDATSLAALIRAGCVSKHEVVEVAYAVITARNPVINAVIDLYDQPVDDPQSAGPFAGVPFLLKDIGAGLAGKRTCCGSSAFRHAAPQANDDELTLRFKRAGLRILGKTNLPELGFNVTTEPEAFGVTRNPFDLTRSAGGSSGGSAAAVAAGMVPIAHATDGAGSIRIPAACCGLVGLKPSRGLLPQGPAHADIYGGLVSEGVITRSVRDMETALTCMMGIDAGAPYAAPALKPSSRNYRVGVLTSCADDCSFDDDALEAVRHAAEMLEHAGHVVKPVESFMTKGDWRVPRHIYLMQVCAQAAADFRGRDIPAGLERINRATIEQGRKLSATDYLAAVRAGQDFARRFAQVWSRCDILLMPTLSGAAPLLGEFPMDHDDVVLHVGRMTRLAPFAGTFNVTGGPALTVNVLRNKHGFSLGVQLAADLGNDLQLLALGAVLHRSHDKV